MKDAGRSSAERRAYEKTRYPDTDVLINKLGLNDAAALDNAERLLVEERLAEGLPLPARKLTVDGLRAIHRHLFQDIYDWAGEFRAYTTGRGTAPFARPEYIEPTLRDLFATLKTEKQLNGLDATAFAARAAFFVNEINAVHPFIEGNGRTQRVWLRVLADQAGHTVAIDDAGKQAWYAASADGFHGRNEPMAALILRSLHAHRPTPMRSQ